MPENIMEPDAPPVGPDPQAPSGQTDPETFSREYVAELRKEAASYRTKAKELETKLQELESSLEAKVEERAREYLEHVYEQYYGQNPYQAPILPQAGYGYDPYAQKWKEYDNRIKSLEERVTGSLSKHAEQELDKMLADLKSKYPYLREKEILAEILAYGDAISPEEIEEVAKASHEEMVGLKDRYITEYLESKKKSAPPLGEAGTPPTFTPRVKPEEMDWEKAREASLAYIKEVSEEE